MLVAERCFGLCGLYVYTSVGVIAGNISVLKTTSFVWYLSPVALGTVVFTSLFLCSDMINEKYGKKAALTSVWIGFFSYALISLLMLLTLLYPHKSGDPFQSAASLLFSPAPSLFLASLFSYCIGQYVDIVLYQFILRKTGRKALWARFLLSTCVGTLIDTTVFSFLAWFVFASPPLSLSTIFWVYICGTSFLRILLTFGNAGFMYFFVRAHRGKKSFDALS